MLPSYDEALQVLRAHNTNESLVKHGMAVGAACRAYARHYGEDEALWRIAGLVHDIDYEEHPTIEEHALVGSGWLRDLEYPDVLVQAVLAHNDYHGIARETLLARTLYACDELAGLITATALVRPTKSIVGLEASSVRKKMKDKAFARGVNREDVLRGAAELGIDLDTHIAFVIAAMTEEADALGLRGSAV